MIATTRLRVLSSVAACVLGLTLALPASEAFGEATISYKKETIQEYEQQLAASQIKAVTINKRLRTVRVTLKNGEYVKAQYAKRGEPQVVAALKAKGIPVVVLTPSEAKKEASNGKVHHKLRYIAGGILVAVIVIVGAVLLIDRRRKRLAE